MKDHYKTLGVPHDASAEEIKKAYDELALIWNPENNKEPGAFKKFFEIKEAYAVLSSEYERKSYDAKLAGMNAPVSFPRNEVPPPTEVPEKKSSTRTIIYAVVICLLLIVRGARCIDRMNKRNNSYGGDDRRYTELLQYAEQMKNTVSVPMNSTDNYAFNLDDLISNIDLDNYDSTRISGEIKGPFLLLKDENGKISFEGKWNRDQVRKAEEDNLINITDIECIALIRTSKDKKAELYFINPISKEVKIKHTFQPPYDNQKEFISILRYPVVYLAVRDAVGMPVSAAR